MTEFFEKTWFIWWIIAILAILRWIRLVSIEAGVELEPEDPDLEHERVHNCGSAS